MLETKRANHLDYGSRRNVCLAPGALPQARLGNAPQTSDYIMTER